MRQKLKLVSFPYLGLIKTASKLLANLLIYVGWTIALELLMLPYQVYRVFIPKNTRKSHPISKFFRKTFESKKSKRFLGAGLTILMLVMGTMTNVLAAYDPVTADGMLIEVPEVEVVTKSTLEKPFEGQISQRFYRFHKGIDLISPVGTLIKPIADGVVKEVSFGRFGYGHSVLIEHSNGLTSLYAHLKNIYVDVDNSVDKDTEIGTVGMTGWTTGPHLHLEIYQDGKMINPESVLPEFNYKLTKAA